MMRIIVFLNLVLVLGLFGCGVKKDPQPPETPADIGHGQPLFKMDQERNPPASIPPSMDPPDKEDEESEPDEL